jgi:hypothetical protein
VNLPTARPRLQAALLALAGTVALYWGALRTGFLNDDYLFLEDSRANGFSGLWAPAGGLANYFRPLSRAAWFGLLGTVAGGNPLVFHVASLALFALAAALLVDLLAVFASTAGVFAGVLWFVTLPLQRVNLTWVSCNQDLLALAASLGALALWRRGRDRLAVLAVLAAVLSKESALPLPAALFFWSWRVEGMPASRAARRALPLLLPLIVWAAGEWHLRIANAAAARLEPGFGPLLAAFAHLAQTLLGLESPSRLGAAFLAAGPSVLALACFAPLAFWLPERAAGTQAGSARPLARHAVPFALAWLGLFALPVAPVAHHWSAYFYTLCAPGGALLIAAAAARLSRGGFVALAMTLLWWHAAACAVPAFAVRDGAWGWTSQLTPYYFERGAGLSAQMRKALLRIAPHPEPGTRFYFATLPPWAGFQMGNGAAIRDAYHDASLESHFYTAFSDSTADGHPCVFLFWNGLDFERLYANTSDPFFQVGADLLLLERPAGAADAFRRGLDAGENAADITYWLGWACLWDGRRGMAERAWSAFGARDDSVAYVVCLRTARTALAVRDSLGARRALYEALRVGIGRREAHAELGELLRGRSAKFALLETKVAARLDPRDWLARRDLVEGLVAARLDDVARRELVELKHIYPEWRADSTAARLARTLGASSPAPGGVAEFAHPRAGGTP